MDGGFDLIVNQLRFVCHLSYVFSVHRAPPRGPYLSPQEYTWRDATPEWLYLDAPREITHAVPMYLYGEDRLVHIVGTS